MKLKTAKESVITENCDKILHASCCKRSAFQWYMNLMIHCTWGTFNKATGGLVPFLFQFCKAWKVQVDKHLQVPLATEWNAGMRCQVEMMRAKKEVAKKKESYEALKACSGR